MEVGSADGTLLRGTRLADDVALVRVLRAGHARVPGGDLALRARQEELALHRAPRGGPTFGDHLLAGRLLPAPRQGAARIPQRRAGQSAGAD
jgi:hypothetical protein